MTLWTGIPLLVAFSSFAMAALTLSRPLTADIIFPAISLFMLLQFPLAMVLLFGNFIMLLLTLYRWVKSLLILWKLWFLCDVYPNF